MTVRTFTKNVVSAVSSASSSSGKDGYQITVAVVYGVAVCLMALVAFFTSDLRADEGKTLPAIGESVPIKHMQIVCDVKDEMMEILKASSIGGQERAMQVFSAFEGCGLTSMPLMGEIVSLEQVAETTDRTLYVAEVEIVVGPLLWTQFMGIGIPKPQGA